MKRRFAKHAVLLLSGGMLLQIGGCLPTLIQILAENLLVTVVGGLLGQVVNNATQTM